MIETLAWLKESMDASKQRMYAGLEIYKFINQLVTAAAYFAIMALPEFHNFSSAGTFHLPFYENFATVIFSKCGSVDIIFAARSYFKFDYQILNFSSAFPTPARTEEPLAGARPGFPPPS